MVPFVHDIQVSSAGGPDVIYPRALCWASYRKCVKYKVRMIVSPKILSPVCDKICPAGRSGCCCHVMAVIWKLDEMSRNKLKRPIYDDRACTSKHRNGIYSIRTVSYCVYDHNHCGFYLVLDIYTYRSTSKGFIH